MGVTYDEMKESKDCGYDDEGYRPDFVPGVLVEREIEEEGVSIDEIRLSRTSAMDSPRAERKSVLPKPLLGLIEDDSETRQKHEAKVTIHHDDESDSSIIINGAEKTLAAGGGLRALRHLKNLKK